ncbi:MAG TPA: four helix bundle protein [Pyrinomonadaceae bacterium]
MATFKKFEDIECWKKARELTKRVYRASRKGLFARDFGLRDQICRASVSIMSNIAEGFDRNGTKEFIQFLSTAKGSAAEV